MSLLQQVVSAAIPADANPLFSSPVLQLLERGLSSVHIPYAYGFSIILLTLLVKAATYPLTKKQVQNSDPGSPSGSSHGLPIMLEGVIGSGFESQSFPQQKCPISRKASRISFSHRNFLGRGLRFRV